MDSTGIACSRRFRPKSGANDLSMKSNRKTGKHGLTPALVGTGIFVLVLFMAEFFFQTWCGVQCIRTGYELTRVETEHRNLLAMQKNLKIEWVRLKSPEVLGRVAGERFGLTIPAPDQIVVVP